MNSPVNLKHAMVSCLFLGVLLPCFASAADVAKTFPGESPSLTSPDKNSVLLNVDAEKDADVARLGDNHALFLRDVKTSKESKVHSYPRHVTAFWSPNSRFVTINDFEASNRATCYVYAVAEGKLINVADSIRKLLESEQKNHHVYFEASEWKDGSTLKVKVTGYGEQNRAGFERWFVYDVVTHQSMSLSTK
jgi:hypothetical protein